MKRAGWLVTAWIAGLLCTGCGWGPGMRSESANRFASQPSPFAPIRCDVLATTWSRVLLASESDLVITSPDGELHKLPMPRGVALSLDSVVWAGDATPRVVIGERWRHGIDPTQAPWLDRVRGTPYHGDSIVLDLDGLPVARHVEASAAMPSPDGTWLAFWRSSLKGRHNLLITPIDRPEPRFVAAVTEADPGSGMSFSACWSADGRSLQVHGESKAWKAFHWIYDPAADRLFRATGAPPLGDGPS